MICSLDPVETEDYLAGFRKKVISQKIPLSGALDLTHKCNLGCVHCFVHSKKDSAEDHQDLPLSEILRIIDEAVEAGCLYLLLTGGEPMLRKDFPEIYRHAKKKGLFVTVFSNATLVSDEIINLFKELPPKVIEVSLYGATAATYEKITGVPGSFEKCINGIKTLLNAGVKVDIKTVLMSLNESEYSQMKKIADDLGCNFHFDPDVFPRLDGDMYPIKLRNSPSDSVKKEFSDEKQAGLWKKCVNSVGTGPISDINKLFMCGAGVTGFHVSPDGYLYPCMMIPWIRYDLSQKSFIECWAELVMEVDQARAPEGLKCNKCNKKNLCGYCPGLLRLEGDIFFKESGYHCKIGAERYNMLIEDKNL